MADPAIRRVAVIGAGIGGIVGAAHLLRAGLQVTVFERSKEPGGIWLHTKEVAIETQYPCLGPADAERHGVDPRAGKERQYLLHAPPGPCYDNLRNNIVTPLLETTLNPWPKDTPKTVTHGVIRDYVQDTCKKSGVDEVTTYGALVTKVWKQDSLWFIDWTHLHDDLGTGEPVETPTTSTFDAVVVASGHYHAPRIPDIPGLAEAKLKWPSRVTHSKFFRNSSGLEGKNVLVIGGGVSSTDISNDISVAAQSIYQSTRNGTLDMPVSALPKNASRVAEIAAIEMTTTDASVEQAPFTVHLKDGKTLYDVYAIIICTGYQNTLPFLPQYNDHSVPATEADERVLVTDGTQVHNLHRDIFYIPDPTLAFIGIPIFNTTFTLFEFQAMAVAAVFSGVARLPPTQSLREEYGLRVGAKGYGKFFHSLKNDEESYVSGLVEWINAGRAERGLSLIEGHTAGWKKEKQLIYEAILRMRALKAEEKLQRERNAIKV